MSNHDFTPTYWWDNPQNGLWWHTLDAEGFQLFSNQGHTFGKTTLESTGSAFANQRLIRFVPSRQALQPWIHLSAGILVVNPNDLNPSQWAELGTAGDRHVLASAVLEVGHIWMPTE
jgi:hypothetical protein